jgi:hypothetical protein
MQIVVARITRKNDSFFVSCRGRLQAPWVDAKNGVVVKAVIAGVSYSVSAAKLGSGFVVCRNKCSVSVSVNMSASVDFMGTFSCLHYYGLDVPY